MNFKNYISKVPWALNFSVEAECLKFTNSNGKAFLISLEDLFRSLRAIYIYGPKIEEHLSANWTYNEDRFRSAFSASLGSIRNNTAATNLGSQTPNTIHSLALYAGYLRGESISNQDEAPNFLRANFLHSIFSNKEKFHAWLGSQNLANKSVESYIGAIEGLLANLIGLNILGINDLVLFDKTRELLEGNESYVESNKKGNGMYQSALNHYRRFLEDAEKESDKPLQSNQFFSTDNTPIAQSLLTKPFAILTGASGTGKTRLAESLAKHYTGGDESRYSVVAVGADWTDSRHVLGFVNHLRPVITAEGELPLYQSTPVLDLLLRATAAENLPHFLVLDEMNLSHVERYFADFLSAMERPKGALELHSGGSNEVARLPRFKDDETGVPRRLPFPRNLFVIGTVNVDETTYMFSPKVLDRANVIEFRMSPQDLENFLSGDGSYPDAGEASASELQAFLALAKEKELEALPVMDEVKTHLAAIFSLMEKARFEFGYRAASEVIRYLKICRHLSDDKAAWDDNGWVADLDTQILQKLLPRLHGGMGRMGPLLTGLGHLCHGTQVSHPARLDSLASLEGDGLFPRSLRKIRSMANVLRDEQFVSFIC